MRTGTQLGLCQLNCPFQAWAGEGQKRGDGSWEGECRRWATWKTELATDQPGAQTH